MNKIIVELHKRVVLVSVNSNEKTFMGFWPADYQYCSIDSLILDVNRHPEEATLEKGVWHLKLFKVAICQGQEQSGFTLAVGMVWSLVRRNQHPNWREK